MIVSAISSLTVPNSQTPNQQNPSQLFMQLIKDIQAGDLTSAKKDYQALTQLQGSSASDPNDPYAQAMNQIGQSLQQGSISGAQQALATLQHEIEGKHQAHHHHHHGGGGVPPAPTTVAPADGSSTSGSTVDLNV